MKIARAAFAHALGAAAFVAALAGPLAREAHAQTSSPYSDVKKLGIAQSKTKGGAAHFGHLLALPGVSANAEHVREIEGHANAVAFFFEASKPSRQASVIEALGPKVAGMVFVNDVFMNADGASRTPTAIAKNLAALKARLGPKLEAGAIPYLAFDEPMWLRQMGVCASAGHTGGALADCKENGPRPEVVAEMRPKLEAWIDQLRGISTQKLAIVVIEAHPMIRDALELPVNADVYGYDCYEDFEQCSRDRRNPKVAYSNRQLWNGLKARIEDFNKRFGGHRRMALTVPTTRVFSRANVRAETGMSGSAQLVLDRQLAAPTERPDAASAALAKRHLDEFASDPMTLVIGNFMWNAGQGGDAMWLGARALPETRALLEQTGRRILGRSGGANATAGAPIVDFVVQSGAIAKRTGAIWTWSSTNATTCKSLSDASLPPLAPNGALYRGPDAAPTRLSYTIACTGPGGTTKATVNYASTR
ncbi:MAG: hypothetical protein IPG50_11415 [Myxococcales bacterium]|nr:hypothetical protein [Myxococcales bacterium]